MVYGLIVPPGVSPEVAEALEGDHHNPSIDEMQTRMYLLEHQYDGNEELRALFPSTPTLRESYAPSDSRWGVWGERYGRQ